MEVVTRTPYLLVPHAGMLDHPRRSLTLIAKATFDLVPGEVARPSEEQPHPTGNEYYPDDEDGAGSCRYESDFAYFKPRADLLLAGTCHVPGGRAVRSCPVAFQVGSRRRELVVFGDRRWSGPMGLGGMTDAVPFTALELRYEQSFGGPGFKPNPVGRGFKGEVDDAGGRARFVPNIEDPNHLMNSPLSRPAPAGFGPLGPMWKSRYSKVGTYNKSWLKKRWPWFPDDFDYAHFNAADEAMQVAGYLRGDEELQFENLHPEHPHFESRLPGLRIRCFLNERVSEGEAPESFRFHEVVMNLDTLWADMDAEKLVLLWRGSSPVRTSEFEEIEQAFMIAESLEEAPASLDECRSAFIADREEEAAELEIEGEPVPDPTVGLATDDGSEEVEEGASLEAAAALKQQITAQLTAALGLAGISLADLPPGVQEQVGRDIDAASKSGEGGAPRDESAADDDRLNEALQGIGLDPNNLPPLTPKAQQEQLRMLSELGISSPASLLADPESASLFAVLAGTLSKVGFDPENLDGLIAGVKKLPGFKLGIGEDEDEDEEDGKAGGEDERIRPLTREIVEAEAVRGESFIGEDLSGLDLSGLALADIDFTGSDFSGAQLCTTDFSGAILAQCRFDGADLAEANLAEANLAEASLAQASLRKSNLARADFSAAVLTEASLDGALLEDTLFFGARMSGASFVEVMAKGAWFIEANLSRAILHRSDFTQADFSSGELTGADFRETILVDASMEAAECANADFSESDLTRLRGSEANFSGCRFTKIQAPESIWAEANCSEADFSYARLQGASFAKTLLERALLDASDMKHARLIQANLRDASVRMVNLFEASLERADLTGTDLRGSNLYSAELVDVVLRDTELAETNLRMTKLA